jgi:hypothetical protein
MNGGKAKKVCAKLYAPKRPLAERDQTPSSITETVRLPAKARSYLKKLARVMAAENLPVRWTTPAGFARKDLGELNAEQLPSGPPQKRSLKINDVLRADFAFASASCGRLLVKLLPR